MHVHQHEREPILFKKRTRGMIDKGEVKPQHNTDTQTTTHETHGTVFFTRALIRKQAIAAAKAAAADLEAPT